MEEAMSKMPEYIQQTMKDLMDKKHMFERWYEKAKKHDAPVRQLFWYQDEANRCQMTIDELFHRYCD